MLDQTISFLRDLLLQWFHYPWIVVLLLAALPIVEARLAIPMAVKYGYGGITPFLLGFFGSSLLVPLLLLILIPFIKWLAKTRLFKRIGETVYEKFSKKSESVDKSSSDAKKMLGIMLFVAVPLPLTGVWTGCAIASIIKLPYGKSLISILAGNAIACTVLAALSALFSETVINYIIAGISLIAVAIAVVLIVKALLRGKKNDNSLHDKDTENSQEEQ